MEKADSNYQMPQILKSNRIICIKDNAEFSDALKAYLTISTHENIDALCKPLKSLGILYLLYVKRFKDGSQVEITNHPQWSEHYYKNHYYTLGPFKNPKQLYENSTYLWSSSTQNKYNIDIRNLFNIDHGISIVYKYDDCNEFFHFGASADNDQIVNFYLNNIDLLKRFIMHFKDQASELIKLSENCRIILPKPSEEMPNNNESMYAALREQFIAATPIQRYHVSTDCPNTYLTAREMECLHWHAMGKSATEIGFILNISGRTVEVHLDNVKRKLNCYKQAQLGYRFADFELPT